MIMDVNVLIFLVSLLLFNSAAGENIHLNPAVEGEKEISDEVKTYMTRIVSHLTEKYDGHIKELEKTIQAQKTQIRKLDMKTRAYKYVISELETKIENLEHICEPLRADNESNENPENAEQIEYNNSSTKQFRKDVGRQNLVRSTDVENRVAFFAYMSSDIHHLGAGQDIVFDHAVTNIGNAYNAHHGTFIAPVAGTYIFSVTLAHYASTSSVRTWTHFVVNGTIVGKMYLNDEQSSHTIIVNLKPGDDVSVKNSVLDGSFTGNYLSMFSGFLLYEDFTPSSIVG